ncbi:alpha/beta hydrolase family protein [Rhizobium sp. KDH_Rht_773_N]
MTSFLITGPETASFTILLAHGAGGAMDSASMSDLSKALADGGFRVARFEFAYMAQRRLSGAVKPPPRADQLLDEYRVAIGGLGAGNLIIGGKSMGGRVASMIADETFAAKKIRGLLCLGYPFHPPGKPEQLRTAHLQDLRTPTLICQGTRDPFGSRQEVESYTLSDQIELLWLEDGDHDIKPRKKISGYSVADHMRQLSEYTTAWAERL